MVHLHALVTQPNKPFNQLLTYYQVLRCRGYENRTMDQAVLRPEGAVSNATAPQPLLFLRQRTDNDSGAMPCHVIYTISVLGCT
jgi:hypothetical protein